MRNKYVLLCLFLVCSVSVQAAYYRPEQICQAAVASLELLNPKLVRLYQQQGKQWLFTVKRSSGIKTYHCQLDGQDILWRLAEQAQWQQSPRLTFHLNAKQLKIQHLLQSALLAEYVYKATDF